MRPELCSVLLFRETMHKTSSLVVNKQQNYQFINNSRQEKNRMIDKWGVFSMIQCFVENMGKFRSPISSSYFEKPHTKVKR